MVDDIVKLNETTSNEISDVSNITSQLPVFEEEINGSNYTKLPISRLASLGVAFQPLVTAVQTVVTVLAEAEYIMLTPPEKQCFK